MKTHFKVAEQKNNHYCLQSHPGSGMIKAVAQANKYLTHLYGRNYSPNTIRSYAYDIKLLFEWLKQEKKSLKGFNRERIIDFCTYQTSVLGSKPKSTNRRLQTCESLFNFIYGCPITPITNSQGWRSSSPDTSPYFKKKSIATQRVRSRVPKLLIDPLATEEVRALFTYMKKDTESTVKFRDYAIAYVMLSAGLRCSEICSLRLEDIQFSARKIVVHGKGKKKRTIGLSSEIAKILKKYIEEKRPSPSNSTALFVQERGKHRGLPLTYEGLRSQFRKIRSKSGVLAANPHRFRHTFGKDMASAGMHLAKLQKMMGHADIQTTMGYIKLNDIDVNEAYFAALENRDKKVKGINL
jgi:integrase/recombinase XerC